MAEKGKLQKRNLNSSGSTINTVIRTNFVEAKIDDTQQDRECKLCVDGDN